MRSSNIVQSETQAPAEGNASVEGRALTGSNAFADGRASAEGKAPAEGKQPFRVALGERVRTLPMPVLLVAGDRDAVIPLPDMLASWAMYPPGTGLHVWHGVGHSPNLDCPRELAALLERFIASAVARGTP